MKKRRLIQAIVVCICVITLVVLNLECIVNQIEIDDEDVALQSTTGVLIEQGEDDLNLIPDKYNTGAHGELKMVSLGQSIDELDLTTDGTGSKLVIDFAYRNKNTEDILYISDYDFSGSPLVTYNEGKMTRKVRIIFNNCAFSTVSKARTEENLVYEFNNCTLNNFYGSNATFNNCFFGHSYIDGLNPFQNVEVNNCFFGDMSYPCESGKTVHTDGTQIYGYADAAAKNISYNNCRFEMPAISLEGSGASTNACIMIQLEFNSGNNITVDKCIINGGGYSIYARNLNSDYRLTNVSLSNVRIGCSKLYGGIYPAIDKNVKIDDMSDTDSLYVASVWKDNGKTHLSVTNDTKQKRTMTVFTDLGRYDFSVDACPAGKSTMLMSDYDSLPFDLDIEIPGDCDYVVCYDTTISVAPKQIRFVNWTDEDIYLNNEIVNTCASGNQLIASGQCGKNVKYTLNGEGVLELMGEGSTMDCHSALLAPWSEYSYFVKKIVIGEGITRLGNQLFRDCSSVSSIILPESLLTIGTRSFNGCTSLTSVALPTSLESIDSSAFVGTPIQSIYCTYSQASLFENDTDLYSRLVFTDEKIEDEAAKVIGQGKCGKSVEFQLTDDGVLTLTGQGETYNYHSLFTPPWYEYRDRIVTVKIEEGIVVLGNQLFCRLDNLENVSLPQGLKALRGNVFMACKKLASITIPSSLESVGRYSFHATGLKETYYEGSKAMWNEITIADKNNELSANLVYNVK